MARFDVHHPAGSRNLLVNCQTEFLDHLSTRFVLPLVPSGSRPPVATRLNPVFPLLGANFVLATNAAATVRVGALGPIVASLANERDAIMAAFDVLTTGF